MQTADAICRIDSSERLTWREICARHPDEWVLLVDVDWVDRVNDEFRSAIVLSHARGRREVFDRLRGGAKSSTDPAGHSPRIARQ